jgi:hypothetical protein
LGGVTLIMALAQEAKPEDSLRECWLARERLRVSEARSINRVEILTARTDAAAEAAEAASPGRPVFRVGARGKLKTRGGSLSSEEENAAVQVERSTPIIF